MSDGDCVGARRRAIEGGDGADSGEDGTDGGDLMGESVGFPRRDLRGSGAAKVDPALSLGDRRCRFGEGSLFDLRKRFGEGDMAAGSMVGARRRLSVNTGGIESSQTSVGEYWRYRIESDIVVCCCLLWVDFAYC